MKESIITLFETKKDIPILISLNWKFKIKWCFYILKESPIITYEILYLALNLLVIYTRTDIHN